MKKQRNLPSSDWLLLSAYLDDQLSEAEKRQMDERLQSDPECQKTLDTLRRTSMMLRSLPVRRVPRNFTLSAQSLPKKMIPSFVNILQFSSAVAAILLVAVFTLELNQTPAQMTASKAAEDMQPAVAMETAKIPAAEADEAEGPMIIFWGAPAPIMGAYGKGGGGGGAEGPGVGGGGAADNLGIGGGGASEEAIPEAAPLVEEVPEFQPTPYAEVPAPEVFKSQPTEGDLQAQEPIAPEPLTGSGPILGVRPSEETTAVEKSDDAPLRQAPAQTAIPFQLIEIVLAALMILTAIPAWLLKRK